MCLFSKGMVYMADIRFNKKRLEVLAKKMKQGSEKAFDEFFYSTRDYLFYFIYSFVKDQTLADDVLQETYITGYEKIGSYKEKNILSWLMTIARNKSINRLKKDNRTSFVDATESDYLFQRESDEKEILLLNDMKKHLSSDELQVVLMHILGNFTHKQISEGLEKPLGTVTWMYSEALKKLRKNLEVHYE